MDWSLKLLKRKRTLIREIHHELPYILKSTNSIQRLMEESLQLCYKQVNRNPNLDLSGSAAS